MIDRVAVAALAPDRLPQVSATDCRGDDAYIPPVLWSGMRTSPDAPACPHPQNGGPSPSRQRTSRPAPVRVGGPTMRHRSTAFAVIALVVALGAARLVAAQDATPSSTAGHSLVGAWFLSFVGEPEDAPSLVVFTSDGVYQQVDYDGTVGIGSWEGTGPTTAAMTFVQQFSNEDGEFDGSSTIRAEIEVAPDGQTFSADFTLESSGEGMPAGEFGPGKV